MSYLSGAGLAEDDGNDVEAEGSVADVVGRKKITGGPCEFCFFGSSDNGLGGCEGFIGPYLYLDKDERAIGVNHNDIDFACFAGEVSGELFEAFSF